MLPILDFSDEIARLQIAFERIGYSWEHPRVKAWLNRLGVPNRYCLEIEAYRCLREHVENLAENPLENSELAA